MTSFVGKSRRQRFEERVKSDERSSEFFVCRRVDEEIESRNEGVEGGGDDEVDSSRGVDQRLETQKPSESIY